MELKSLFKQTELFRGMSEESLSLLAAKGRQRGFGQGDTLFVEGSKGSEFFLLMEGDVRLYKTSPDGQEIALRIIRPGEIFAEVVIFQDTSYPASAVALSAGSVLAITGCLSPKLLDEKGSATKFQRMLMKSSATSPSASSTSLPMRWRSVLRFSSSTMARAGSTRCTCQEGHRLGHRDHPETLSRLINRLKGLVRVLREGNTLSEEKDT
jgi:CRP-like cAMP-binding protein